MAGLNTKSTGSKSGSRKDMLEEPNQDESHDSRKLLDNLARLERITSITDIPSVEAKASPSR